MEQRLQKILSERGVASRRGAEKIILAGLVTVDGRTASLGDSADPERQTILVSGKPLPRKEKRVYLMLNKPRGYVTTLSDEKGRQNAASLVADCGVRVYPVGRLDMDSEGLLLFTNDGALTNALTHPRGEVNKTYEVWTTGYAPGGETLLTRPILLDGRRIRPPKVELLHASGGKAQFLVTIHEGRNRQIRRMCQAAGMDVTRLRRVREGALCLGDLPLGAWRYLTDAEIANLAAEEKTEEASKDFT